MPVCLARDHDRHLILLCSTGTKCLAASSIPKCNGLVLHDCHAEVLALRGFNYWLLKEVHHLIRNPTHTSDYIESVPATISPPDPIDRPSLFQPPFKLRQNVSIHFFTTQAPCGDASMEILINSMDPREVAPWQTPEPNSTAPDLQGRGHFSMLGYVRRKPSRADAESTLSKSCTDKLAVKQFTSIISFPADLFVQRTDNAFIKNIITYSDQYDQIGFGRALGPHGRLANISDGGHFFGIEQLPRTCPRFSFERPSGVVETAPPQQPKAANASMMWVASPDRSEKAVHEVLVNGVKQGYKQWDHRQSKASVTSRRHLIQLVRLICTEMPGDDSSDLPFRCRLKEASAAISKVLDQDQYSKIKESPIRYEANELKASIKRKLGSWQQNSGDAEWPCD